MSIADHWDIQRSLATKFADKYARALDDLLVRCGATLENIGEFQKRTHSCGDMLSFDVFRNNARVGYLRVTTQRDPENMSIQMVITTGIDTPTAASRKENP